MTYCRTCGKPLPSICRRVYHIACRPSRQDLSAAEIERRMAAAAEAIRRARRLAA
jgi:hypothetical protein